MDLELRQALVTSILGRETSPRVIQSLDLLEDGSGSIQYDLSKIRVDPTAPGFRGGETRIGDEELVRAYLVQKLVKDFGYRADGKTIEIEKTYQTVGRPGNGKGGRVDLLVRGSKNSPNDNSAFLFIECKSPDKFDSDLKYLDGQLFRLSRQESIRPRYLVYYTVELKSSILRDRLILIDTETYPDYESWDSAGQPITDALPISYGIAKKRLYGNVSLETEELRPLDVEASAQEFSRLQGELHDVIWGGGGTNNNEVFVLITRLILAKIYDEKETSPGQAYEFQRRGNALSPEDPTTLVSRLNNLYKEAENGYLALKEPSPGPAFDTSRVSAEKIAYVVGRLEGLSVTENLHNGDLLGEFFEQIVASDFTQTKGQFFTPVKLIRFMLELADVTNNAYKTMLESRDHLGRPRLPYVIDPSAGSGSFLIEYMKTIRSTLGTKEMAKSLPRRLSEAHETWFSGITGNAWARDFLFGIENNYDLGLSAKVNMVLHGDGSMNTWIASGLLPFEDYWVEGRHNLLGTVVDSPGHPYVAPRNEQFDLILSNPPFSIKLSPDEKQKIENSFDLMSGAQSEAIFIERWYQLLREGGRFCTILPEAILDTSTSENVRLFLIEYFHIEAVISLPYDAFRPFTSTKTSVLMARKRSLSEVENFRQVKASVEHEIGTSSTKRVMEETIIRLGWDSDPIFMAEPKTVGYKRRKNLPDLQLHNDLYVETNDGLVDFDYPRKSMNVLTSYRETEIRSDNSQYGFWTTLGDVTAKESFRLDPKYRWLWDRMNGVCTGTPERAVKLSTWLELVRLPKVLKGDLATETRVIDLEYVESRQGLLSPDVPTLDIIGSDKVKFEGCDLAISKLEPYLGKLLIQPQSTDLGSTEWVGLKVIGGMPISLAAYLLMQPELCEAYRRLQSGKRHARFDIGEFLSLRSEIPPQEEWSDLVTKIDLKRNEILTLRASVLSVREDIDRLLSTSNSRVKPESDTDIKAIREIRHERVAKAKERLGKRVNYDDSAESIRETEAMIKSLSSNRNRIIEEQ